MEEEIRTCLDQGYYQEAFELVVARYQNKVFRLACSMLGNEALAEETAQEVFLRVWKALGGYRGQASLSTWIYAITRNTCLSALRTSAGKQMLSLEEPAVLAAAEARTGAAAEPAQLDVAALLAQLPDKHRQVLTLFYMEGKSYEEVARLLDWPMGTVKTYLHRARKQLAAAATRATMDRKEARDAVRGV